MKIPPLFYDTKFITDFKEKEELFDSFLKKQSPLICIASKFIVLIKKIV